MPEPEVKLKLNTLLGRGSGRGLITEHPPRWPCPFFEFSGAVVGTAILPPTKLKFSVSSLVGSSLIYLTGTSSLVFTLPLSSVAPAWLTTGLNRGPVSNRFFTPFMWALSGPNCLPSLICLVSVLWGGTAYLYVQINCQ